MRRKRSPEPGRPAGGAGPTGPSAPAPGRVGLAGEWSAARAAALRSLLTVVDDPRSPVDWLLVAVGSGPPPPVALRRPAQPCPPRVAVVDPDGRWPAGADRDVYLAGDVGPGELVAALRLAGTRFTIRRLATPARMAHPAGATDAETGPAYVGGVPGRVGPNARGLPAGLTGREVELLRALCAGLGNDQIARRLHISRSTVEFHLTRIFRKLDVSSRAEAIVRALGHDPTLAAGRS
ncbi:response regulator transcription factor [Micromonospora sp. NPDC126480]|uniref:helix-turn-helix transcriptional regulator n=1 Tax=Micromonospora sp. NPDC126480 TaxID=3155312 RepID=UPI003323B839